jgi:hypothetical protein
MYPRSLNKPGFSPQKNQLNLPRARYQGPQGNANSGIGVSLHLDLNTASYELGPTKMIEIRTAFVQGCTNYFLDKPYVRQTIQDGRPAS